MDRARPLPIVGLGRRSCRRRGAWRKRRERPCKPGSVPPLAGSGGHFSGTGLAPGLERPTRKASAVRVVTKPSLFGLSPGGVCPAGPVTRTAVRSYRTVSPLPTARDEHARPAVCFLWHFPWPRDRLPLTTTL